MFTSTTSLIVNWAALIAAGALLAVEIGALLDAAVYVKKLEKLKKLGLSTKLRILTRCYADSSIVLHEGYRRLVGSTPKFRVLPAVLCGAGVLATVSAFGGAHLDAVGAGFLAAALTFCLTSLSYVAYIEEKREWQERPLLA